MSYGKIIITKKSGPGDLTGITEVDLTNISNVSVQGAPFDGLQFNKEGDYVLVVSDSSNSFEPVELKVTVIKEDDTVEQKESRGTGEEKATDGSRPIIAQIDKPTIVVPPIKMNQDGTGTMGQKMYTEGMGFTPLIWYKSFSIDDRYIKDLRLYHDGIIPKIEFTFIDNKELMKSEVGPTNNDTIDLFLNSSSKNIKSIHISFKIESFEQGPNIASQKYTITGCMNIPDLYVQNNKVYNGTSFNVLRKISGELGLGFNSNIDSTNDDMSWRNCNKKPHEFINEIVSHSYINDMSYMGGYIDYYYCFNYVDIEKEYNRDVSKDIGLNTSGIDEQAKSDDIERLMPLVLTNDKSQMSTSNYIDKYEKVNNSTEESLNNGYMTITKAYDRISKQFLVFNVDSTTIDQDKSVILKGEINEGKYKDENIKHVFTGKLDTDNVHKDYNYADTQNKINLSKLNNIEIEVTLPQANWNLYKYQKVNVSIINELKTVSNPTADFRYSGGYIIKNIEYNWNGINLTQELKLIRKELSKTPDEIKNDPPPQVEKDVKEDNLNPIPGATSSIIPAPNAIYNIDEVYIVQDKDGNRYELTITEILPNGIEVNGTLKRK